MKKRHQNMRQVMYPKSKEKYGEMYKDHLFEQYRLYVNSADKISERRANTNTFFLTVLTLLISLIGIVTEIGNNIEPYFSIWLIIVTLSGILLCYSWYKILESYRQLNTGKFIVIHEIEKKLPLALYKSEWEVLEHGNNPEIYKPLTYVEKWVPRIFSSLFLILLALGVYVLIMENII